jgi:hypothetical protein
MVAKMVTMSYFDVNKEITVQCDASSYGLGTTLLQENKQVIMASRTLTKTEQNYAVIESGTLAVLFA